MGRRVAYGRNDKRVSSSSYADDTSVPVRTSNWNQDPVSKGLFGFTKVTATLASDVLLTKDDSLEHEEDDGQDYADQSTLIEVVPQSGSSTDAILKIDITDTLENDILYLFKATESDTITITNTATPSAAGHIKTQLSGGATLTHDGVPIMLIQRGNYWYEFGADGAASGDISGVTAGTGLTGGGVSGSVTLNVIGGAGITADADEITIDSTVATLDGAQTITGKNIVASQLTGTIEDDRMPDLTGDVTTASGAVDTTIGANKVLLSMVATAAKTEALIIACSDEGTALAGTETAKFVLPYGFEVTKVKGSLNTTGAANVVCTVTRGGSALATVTISGTTANDSSPTNTTGAENDVVAVSIGAADATATGLKIYIIGYQT